MSCDVDEATESLENELCCSTGILRLPHRWQRVVDNVTDYIEGLYKFHTGVTFVGY